MGMKSIPILLFALAGATFISCTRKDSDSGTEEDQTWAILAKDDLSDDESDDCDDEGDEGTGGKQEAEATQQETHGRDSRIERRRKYMRFVTRDRHKILPVGRCGLFRTNFLPCK